MLQLEVDALTQEGEPDKAMALLDRSGHLYMSAQTYMYVYMYVCMYVGQIQEKLQERRQ